MATPEFDLQGLWETTLREVALEGSNGCTLERLWKLVGLVGPGGPGEKEGASGQSTQNDPQEFVKAWLWRTIVTRRGKELFLATFNDQGESNNLRRGDPEDSRLAAIKDITTVQKEQGSVGVVASRSVRLRALGLDTANLKSVTLISPAYLQVLEVVGRYRGWGASAAEVLDGVNRIISSNKKDDYLEVVAAQGTKYRAANKVRDGGFLGSEVMNEKQLYPVYDRLASTGLIFKSSVQKVATGHEQDGRAGGEQEEGMYRFVVLYLKRFKDSILLPPDTKLEPTAKEVFLEMLVDHLLEAGGSGAVVPWYNVRKDLFLDKNASGRLRNFLQKESASPGFPIRIQLLDVRAMDYVNTRRGRRLEWCVSLKHSSELEPQALKRPLGISLVRSIMAIIKSRGEEGANADLMQRLLHCSKRPTVKILDFMVKNASSYGVWRGYTREGRSARVQNLVYSEELLGRGNTAGGPAGAGAGAARLPSAIKTDHLSASMSAPAAPTAGNPPFMAPSPLQDAAGLAASAPPASTASPAVGGGLGGPGVSAGVGGSADGGGGGGQGGEGGGEGVGDAGGGLDDVNWSDDDALDAMVDDIGREVDEAQAKFIKKMTEARVKFEMNPAFPPDDCPPAVRSQWMQMTPKDRRKNFVLYELEQCRSIPMPKLLQLIKMLEGPGPALQRATLDTVVNELVQEGKVQRKTAPAPELQAGRCPLKMFGNGDMVLHTDAKTDAKSMAAFAENFYALEEAVHRETTRIRTKEHSGEYYSWNASNSPERFLVYKRKMHRTMILHRELLRCLPKRPSHRVGSRAIDLDRVILDTPLSTFLTMFGYPPDNLHTPEMYTVLKKAEVRKATIRQSPVAIWEHMRTVPWYKEALTSSLKILHEMRVLTATDPPPATALTLGNSASSSSSPPQDAAAAAAAAPGGPFAYLHDTAKEIQPMSTGAESAAAIDKFHKDMAAAAAARRVERKHAQASPPANQYGVNPFSSNSARGLRRDKRARSAAAEALLRQKSPPGEMRMGLGWAVLHVDLVVYTEDSRKSLPKRVTQHLEWSNFWSTYQFFGTGQRTADLAKEDGLARENLGIADEVAHVPHALASWLLQKVPYLADAKEWGVEGNEKEDLNRWHRAKMQWTEEQDLMLIMAVKRFEPEPTYANSKPKPSGPGRPDRNVYKQALRPVAEELGKSADAAWRRYRNVANVYNKHAPLGQELPLPVHNRHSKKRGADEVDDETTKANKRKGRRTGMLRSDGPIGFKKNFGHLQFQASDLNESRMKAREEAAIAKAAGFEWTNEEGSWEEDGRGGGFLPRPFDRWGWTMEELAAFTAVRQVLLVPEERFDPGQALERMQAFHPPTLQKAYRSLLAMEQIDISKSAWAANDHSVHDSLDHEVYKMIGRHGTNLVSRGVTAAGSMHALGIAEKWTSPLPAFQADTADSAVHPLALQLKALCRTGGAFSPPGPPAALPVTDIGSDRSMMAKLLEAVVRGNATFAVKSPPGSLSTPEGGTAALGVGVAARTLGGGSGSGSGTATGSFTAGSSAPAPSPSPVGAATSATTPRGGGGAASSSTTGGASAAPQVGRPGGVGGDEVLPGTKSTATAAVGMGAAGGATGGVDSGGGGDNAKRDGASSAGGGQQQQQEGSVVCTTSRYRSSKSIDTDIMATVLAEARPRGAVAVASDAGADGGALSSSPAAGKDGRDVYGPEMEWGLSTSGGGNGGGEEEGVGDGSGGSSAADVVLGALKDAKEEGMRLSELRRVAFRAASGAAGGVGEAADLLAVMGRVLRSSAVVCVCDAEDVRYMHRDSCGLWTVAPTGTADSGAAAAHTQASSPTSTPMHLEEEEEEEEEDAPNSAGQQGRKAKGKGKKKAGTTPALSGSGGSGSLSAKGGPKPKIVLPWMSLAGDVNLRLLNRTRHALVSYVRSNPGCQAADVREAELSFLTGGETMLLLRDLVRRKVLRQHTVLDTSAGTLAGGWGLSQRDGGDWATGGVGGTLDQHVPSAATTSFTLAFGWRGMLSRIEGILPC